MTQISDKAQGSLLSRYISDNGPLLLVIAVGCIPLFYLLGRHGIYMWDEAIYANNALEMLLNGNAIVPYNNDAPSLYNVKPPLGIWLQVISMKIFGISEWALRLPSALSGLGILILMIHFSRKWFYSINPGLWAALFIVSAQGFVRVHLTRSADLDAVNLFFTTIYALLFLDMLIRKKVINRNIFLIAFFATLAFFTKSLAGLMPLFPMLVIGLFNHTGKEIFAKKETWISASLGLFTIVLYYVIRENLTPGYFAMVWDTEFLRFTHNVMPWHKQPFYYYFHNFYRLDFLNPHILLAVPAWIFLSISVLPRIKSASKYFGLFIIIYIVFISIPTVKLQWYDAPVYPFVALILGLAVSEFTSNDRMNTKFPNFSKFSTLLVFALIILFPYRKVIQKISNNTVTEPLEQEGHFMRNLANSNPDIKSYRILMKVQTPEHLDQMLWYKKKLENESTHDLEHIDQIKQINLGDVILVCQPEQYKLMENTYDTEEIYQKDNCHLIKIGRMR